MSIRLQAIGVGLSRSGAKPLFDGLDMEVPAGARIGVLGPPKSGKSTLLRLMCGTAFAESGRVERRGRISWPIPLSSFLSVTGTVAQNIRFVGRLYGIADAEFCRRIAGSAGISDYLGVQLRKCPSFVKPRLALALGVGIDFDTYLFDGSLAGTDKSFKNEAGELVAARIADRGCVLATAVPSEAEGKCDSVYVLEAGRARYFADAQEGIGHFKGLLKAQRAKPSSTQEKRQADDDGDVEFLGDIDMVSAAVADTVD